MKIISSIKKSFSNKLTSNLEVFEKEFHKLERSNIPISSRESLLIYRDCLKLTKKFYWYNDNGQKWSEILKKSVRKDFENNKNINDTVESGKKQVQARQAILELEYKLVNVEFDIKKFLSNTRTDHDQTSSRSISLNHGMKTKDEYKNKKFDMRLGSDESKKYK